MVIRMNKFGFRSVIVLLLLSFSAPCAFAKKAEAYEQRVNKYELAWKRLIPRYGKAQFAGMMGLVSIGTGWDYGRNKQWETDLLLGFLPKYSSRHFKITMTLKQNFIPWNCELSDRCSLDPLVCGLYINTIFNEDFWTDQPSKYPSNYYPISTKLRFNIFIGQRISFKIPHERRFFAKSVSFFYELGTSDIHVLNKVGNKHLGVTDILSLSFGVKFQWL